MSTSENVQPLTVKNAHVAEQGAELFWQHSLTQHHLQCPKKLQQKPKGRPLLHVQYMKIQS
jgi:hypothetical protein